jgi:ABC-type multidrug transport system ATPase subunit
VKAEEVLLKGILKGRQRKIKPRTVYPQPPEGGVIFTINMNSSQENILHSISNSPFRGLGGIALTDAGKRFNRDWIFRHLNFTFHRGISYAITGPNGSGKSTLLQAIAGSLNLSEGGLDYLKEQEIGNIEQGILNKEQGTKNQYPVSGTQHPAPSIQHPVSSIQYPASNIKHPGSSIIDPEIIYQQISICAPYLELIEEMTAKEFLHFHHQFKPVFSSVSINEILVIIGLQNAADKQIRYYSSGMKQRIKLAQAIFSDTPVLLLDEPCTNLDTAGYALYHELISRYALHKLIIVSSNDSLEMDFCSERINIMDYK